MPKCLPLGQTIQRQVSWSPWQSQPAPEWASLLPDNTLFFSRENAATIHYFTEPNAGQIQEGIGEAVNNIVKHFHKPEKEVLWAIKSIV
jgi:hypothetical protein